MLKNQMQDKIQKPTFLTTRKNIMLHDIKIKKTTLALDLLIANKDNPRLKPSIEHLYESMEAVGQERPLLVEPTTDGKFIVIRGNCRLATVQAIALNNPQAYNNHFKKGLQVEIISEEISPIQRARLCTDHGEVKGLESPYELFLSSKLLYLNNCTESQWTQIMSNSLQILYPLKGANQIKALKEALATSQAEYFAVLKKIRRGLSQYYKSAVLGPNFTEEFLRKSALGEPVDFKLTQADTGTLYSLMKKDLALKDADGIQIHSRSNHGPLVLAYIEKIKSKQSESETKEKPQAIMSKTDIEKLLDQVESKAYKLILGRILNNVTSNDLVMEMDEQLK